jgi:hypothetical protein
MGMWSAAAYYLSILVALVFAFLAFYYLLPGVYHPLSADTVLHTTPHLTYAAVFIALAALTIVLGRLVRPEKGQ